MQFLTSFRALIGAVIISAGTLVATVTLNEENPSAMYIAPSSAAVAIGETQEFSVVVKSNVPVNAFAGELIFDSDLFTVTNIDYNTSIANIWVEEPWYNRANNSVYFAGGTTAADGFVGTDTLLNITLQATAEGSTTLSLHGVRIMAHDGLGSEVPLVTPLDALFIADTSAYVQPIAKPTDTKVQIVENELPLDTNGDGEENFQDIGVILLNLGSSETKYDFNGDGKITWRDVRQWTHLHNLRTQ